MYAMNPLVIVGVVTVSLLAAGMIVSFSGDQLRYSQTAERIAEMQSERTREELDATYGDGRITLENPGSVPVHIVEIRILDDDGHMIHREKADSTIAPARGLEVPLDAGLLNPEDAQ